MSAPILPTELATTDLTVCTDSLVRQFRGGASALDGLNLTVPTGSVYVLAGRNGAGKTTALHILLDLLRPTIGTATVFGLDTRAHGPRIRAGVGFVPESHDTGYPWMRVGRLMEHHATYRPSWDGEYARRLVEVLELKLDARWKALSKGQARRVQLAMALAHHPALLLLDEPTYGLDPVVRDRVFGLIAEHAAKAETTVLVSTHLLHGVERLSDHLGLLRDGRLIAQVTRDCLHRRLRRYRAVVPERWKPPDQLVRQTVKRNRSGREIAWTLWGEEDRIRSHLHEAGADINSITALTVEEAALALLSCDGEPR